MLEAAASDATSPPPSRTPSPPCAQSRARATQHSQAFRLDDEASMMKELNAKLQEQAREQQSGGDSMSSTDHWVGKPAPAMPTGGSVGSSRRASSHRALRRRLHNARPQVVLAPVPE